MGAEQDPSVQRVHMARNNALMVGMVMQIAVLMERVAKMKKRTRARHRRRGGG